MKTLKYQFNIIYIRDLLNKYMINMTPQECEQSLISCQNLSYSSPKRREFGLYVNSGNSAIAFLLLLGDSTKVISRNALPGFLDIYYLSTESISFLSTLSQSILSKKGWFLISAKHWLPNLLFPTLCSNFLIRSTAETEKWGGYTGLFKAISRIKLLWPWEPNGGFPDSISKRRIPRVHKSIFLSYGCYNTISGAKYWGVPRNTLSLSSLLTNCLAKPKSDNFIWQSSPIRIFSGFKSRYIDFCSSCKYCNPNTTLQIFNLSISFGI